MLGDQDDARLRAEAMTWLERRTDDGREPITRSELADFTFDGAPFRLIATQQGIWKPAVLRAALSIVTAAPRVGRQPYDDTIGADGVLRYKWRGEQAGHPDNRALRAAADRGLPLIWFRGVEAGIYLPVFPIKLFHEDRARREFHGAIDPAQLVVSGSAIEDQLRRYVQQQTWRRLHQPVFRTHVPRAYTERCAVCSLHHRELLDAAHILPDRDDLGVPAVRNGLALCKIHHSAYDANILGVTPEQVVQIRPDLLAEIDGPMLLHGLQGRHGQRLMVVPRRRTDGPDPDLLGERYRRFLAAG